MSIERADILALLPALLVLGGALAVLAVNLLLKRNASRAPLEGVAYLALFGALLALRARFPHDPGNYFGGALQEDMLSRFVGLAILVATIFLVLLSGGAIAKRNLRPAEFLSLALFSATGMMLLAMSADLITLFLNIELMSLAIYVLAGMVRTDRRSNEAAIKYFVNGSFASAFLLFGMALLYGATGTVRLTEMAGTADNVMAMLGLTLMLVGFGFKVGAVPFHFWVPDVYEGAPTAVTAFMSVAVKAAGFAALLRFVIVAFPAQPEVWTEPLWVVAALTMIVGNVMAVAQDSVKRMLAYSSVAHTGYALVGVVAESPDSTVFYLFVYTFMTLGAFAFLTYAARGTDDREHISGYAGLARRRPWAALAMTIFMLSLAGIPPTAGFFGKFALFEAGIRAGLYGLVVIGLLTTAVSLYYYLRVVVYMYMREPEPDAEAEIPDLGASIVVFLTSISIILLGLLPSTYLAHARQSASIAQ